MASQPTRKLSWKITEKGGLSVYGLNARFPVTLYGDQWLRLIDVSPEIKTYILANKALLASKPVQ